MLQIASTVYHCKCSVPHFTKGIIVTKALQELQYQKHKEWHILYFSADNSQKGLVQPLVEHSNAAVVLLKPGPRPTGRDIITSQTLTISPTCLWLYLNCIKLKTTVSCVARSMLL